MAHHPTEDQQNGQHQQDVLHVLSHQQQQHPGQPRHHQPVVVPNTPNNERFVSLIFLWLGIGGLVPWNAFISSKEYLTSRLCHLPIIESNHLENTISVLFNSASVGCLVVSIVWQWFRESNSSSSFTTAPELLPTELVLHDNNDDDDDDEEIGEENETDEQHRRRRRRSRRRRQKHDLSSRVEEVDDNFVVVDDNLLNTATTTMEQEEQHTNSTSLVCESAASLSCDSIRSTGSSSHSSASSSSSLDHSSSYRMVMIPLFISMTSFWGQTLLVTVLEMDQQLFQFLFFSCGVALCGICVAISNAGIVATAGLLKFPHTSSASVCLQPFMTGQALGGVFVSVANFLAAMAEDTTAYQQAHCNSNNNNNSNSSSSTENETFSINDSIITTSTNRHISTAISRQILTAGVVGAEDDTDSAFVTTATTSTTCTLYEHVDYAVLVYFLVGSVILALCLLGYHYIHKQMRLQHRDHYETIFHEGHDHQNQTATTDESISSGRVVIDVQSPRVGLELNHHHHLHRPYQQQQPNINSNHNNRHPASLLQRQESDDEYGAVVVVVGTPTSAVLQQQQQRSSSFCENGGAGDGIWRDHGVPPPPPPPQPHPNTEQDIILVPSSSNNNNNETVIVWNQVKGPAFCIFFCFFVTLSLFPGWTSELKSVRQCQQNNRLFNDLFTPFSFVLFNVGDWVGRMASAKLPLRPFPWFSAKRGNNNNNNNTNLSRTLVGLSLSRLLFFPLFFVCVSSSNSSSSNSNFVIRSDVYSMAVQFFFAFSNGWLVSIAFCHAPTTLPTTTHSTQEKMSEILTLALSSGLLLGSFFSFWVSSSAS